MSYCIAHALSLFRSSPSPLTQSLHNSGRPLAFVAHGIPISTTMQNSIRSLFIRLKNQGVYAKILKENHPTSKCYKADQKTTGARSLTTYDLVGVWIVTAGFALIGIIVSIIERRIIFSNNDGSSNEDRTSRQEDSSASQQHSKEEGDEVDKTKYQNGESLSTIDEADITKSSSYHYLGRSESEGSGSFRGLNSFFDETGAEFEEVEM